ncbi:hypothetical protein NC651_024642 [Populus alba x Populus x berolinensis]|nr:hypothetical protein NC651_024642 [Populus alba x Populus x berolinensis]
MSFAFYCALGEWKLFLVGFDILFVLARFFGLLLPLLSFPCSGFVAMLPDKPLFLFWFSWLINLRLHWALSFGLGGIVGPGGEELAQRFVPVVFASDGLVEGFYDPDAYNPEQGKFRTGLEFDPERTRQGYTD